MFQIGDRRMLIAYLGLLSDLLGKAAKEGSGVVRSISAEICSEIDRTTPRPSFAKEGNRDSLEQRSIRFETGGKT